MTFVDYDELAKLRYGRLLWRNPAMRDRLVRHWTDPRHPSRERYLGARAEIEELLASREADDALDRRLRERGTSLRAVMRNIPPVFGGFWRESDAA